MRVIHRDGEGGILEGIIQLYSGGIAIFALKLQSGPNLKVGGM